MDQIAYDHGVVADYASDTVSRAGQLEQLHADTAKLTNALQEFFEGHGATGFFDAQFQMLSGLQGLVDTVRQHGMTTNHVLGNAVSVDQQMPGLFWT